MTTVFEGDQPILKSLQAALNFTTNEIKASTQTLSYWGCLCLMCFLMERGVCGGSKKKKKTLYLVIAALLVVSGQSFNLPP